MFGVRTEIDSARTIPQSRTSGAYSELAIYTRDRGRDTGLKQLKSSAWDQC